MDKARAVLVRVVCVGVLAIVTGFLLLTWSDIKESASFDKIEV